MLLPLLRSVAVGHPGLRVDQPPCPPELPGSGGSAGVCTGFTRLYAAGLLRVPGTAGLRISVLGSLLCTVQPCPPDAAR